MTDVGVSQHAGSVHSYLSADVWMGADAVLGACSLGANRGCPHEGERREDEQQHFFGDVLSAGREK